MKWNIHQSPPGPNIEGMNGSGTSATLNNPHAGQASWSCPSNIAIVKYWGKCGDQIPCNPSVSLTLNKCRTITTLSWETRSDHQALIDPEEATTENQPFLRRVGTFLEKVSGENLPWVGSYSWKIHTHNTFPHGAGIASSASAFGALALCLCSAAQQEGHPLPYPNDLFRSAAAIARIGSGSATRSVYGGWVWWGKEKETDGKDEYGIPLTGIHPLFARLQDTILVVSSAPKAISSSEGHRRMENNPYASERYRQSRIRAIRLAEILRSGDWEAFSRITRQEALDLHGLMMVSEPGFMLIQPGTLHIIQAIEKAISRDHLQATWTLDAGPNVHLLYPESSANAVKELVTTELAQWCDGGQWIEDGAGNGPEQPEGHAG